MIGLIFGAVLIMVGVLVWLIMASIKGSQAPTPRTSEQRHCTMLKILVPKDNAKGPLAAEHMFASLHGIFRIGAVAQELISFEIAATDQSTAFYVLVPTHLREFIEGQIYAQYPTVEITQVRDYANVPLEGMSVASADIALTMKDFYPIKTFVNFDVDPLAGITGVLSKVEHDEMLAIQYVLSPVDDGWHTNGIAHVNEKKTGKVKETFGTQMRKSVNKGVHDLVFGPPKEAPKPSEVKLSAPEEAALKGVESKVTKLGFLVAIRVVSVAPNVAIAQSRVESVIGAFKQYNTTNLNGFTSNHQSSDPSVLRLFRSRVLGDSPYHMNVEELASVFHLPGESVATPGIMWAGAKKGEPPKDLPIVASESTNEIATIGLTSFRDSRIKFGIKTDDRRLHAYVIGKTGTGKSTLLQNIIYDDILQGRGLAIVDPHGSLADDIINFIPENRIKDVVYFNPSDRDWPLAFNLLENVDDDMRNIVASGLMSIFTKLWANVWSARMEYILRNSILATLEVPDSTLLGIMRILNDPIFRKHALEFVTDPVVRDFFELEYERYDAKFRQEAIAPIQNKVGQFLSSSTIRNIVGQPKSTFNLRRIMDEGKIFIADLSIGKIGEDNSALLGAMLITKMQIEAMTRANVPEAERRDFYLFVDEFQNFATESFATILSEARKYHLNLTLANQYLAQLPEPVSDAIFGNVGTFLSFRVGATDADKLVKEFAPVFDAGDLVNLPNRQIYVKMAIDGVTSTAFSAHTLPPKGVVTDNRPAIVEFNHGAYARPRSEVESNITAWGQNDFKPPIEKEYDELRQHPFIIGDRVYKEFSAKGGARWFFGQPPEIVSAEEERAAFEAKRKGKDEGDVTSADELPVVVKPGSEALAKRENELAIAKPAADQPVAPSGEVNLDKPTANTASVGASESVKHESVILKSSHSTAYANRSTTRPEGGQKQHASNQDRSGRSDEEGSGGKGELEVSKQSDRATGERGEAPGTRRDRTESKTEEKQDVKRTDAGVRGEADEGIVNDRAQATTQPAKTDKPPTKVNDEHHNRAPREIATNLNRGHQTDELIPLREL